MEECFSHQFYALVALLRLILVMVGKRSMVIAGSEHTELAGSYQATKQVWARGNHRQTWFLFPSVRGG